MPPRQQRAAQQADLTQGQEDTQGQQPATQDTTVLENPEDYNVILTVCTAGPHIGFAVYEQATASVS